MIELPFTKRVVAMTDIETTGLNPLVHEIIEIGCVLLDPESGEFLSEFEVRIHPLHLERAHPQALLVNGYNAELWRDAISLEEGLDRYAHAVRGTVFCAQNATFDWSFLSTAFMRANMQLDIDYHRLDLLSLAYARLKKKGVVKYNLNALASFFNIEGEPVVHRAVNGARIAAQVFNALMRM